MLLFIVGVMIGVLIKGVLNTDWQIKEMKKIRNDLEELVRIKRKEGE